jgi:predicted nuclease with TOPRIM domain
LEDINEQQENAFTTEIEKNEDMKKAMLEEYKNRMNNSNLSEEEKASMLAELNAKMTNINGELDKEQANQQAALNEALARRKAKKNALRQAMNKLTDKKEIEDEHYHNALSNI